jgi:hypothetical protein
MKMSRLVAARAQRNEIPFGIIPHPAARADMVHLKVLRSPAILASPAVARQHFASELAIGVEFKP